MLLTHRHFDHLRELPLFLDNVYAMGAAPVAIGCEAGTRRALFRHLFNGELWPDLRRFSPPAARFFEVRVGRTFRLEGLQVTPIRMRHTVPTVGYLFRRGSAAAAILGDTGFSERLFA
ncbi:MAG: MBL fold metallo-hydrolase, partial [Thermoanaerobaculia bacterium]